MKRLLLFLALGAVAVAAQTVNITLTLPCPSGVSNCTPSTATGTLKLMPRVLLTGVTFAPSAIQPGQSAVGTVSLNVAASTTLSITIGAYPAGLSGPSSMSIPAGATSGTFTVMASAVIAALQPVVTNWTYGLLPPANMCCGVNPVFMEPGPRFDPAVWIS